MEFLLLPEAAAFAPSPQQKSFSSSSTTTTTTTTSTTTTKLFYVRDQSTSPEITAPLERAINNQQQGN
jgi:hypothetical protein